MKRKIKIVLFLFIWITPISVFSQNQKAAQEAVKIYLKEKSSSYEPVSFSEAFKTVDAEEIQSELFSNRTVVYAIKHSYYFDNKLYESIYFYFDEDMNIVGFLTTDQIMQLTMKKLFSSKRFMEVLDSLEIDTTTINTGNIEFQINEKE
jgi:hypothetical protein